MPDLFNRDAIAARAYALFVRRGRQPGHALDDWLEAERQLKALAAASVHAHPPTAPQKTLVSAAPAAPAKTVLAAPPAANTKPGAPAARTASPSSPAAGNLSNSPRPPKQGKRR